MVLSHSVNANFMFQVFLAEDASKTERKIHKDRGIKEMYFSDMLSSFSDDSGLSWINCQILDLLRPVLLD